MGCSQGKSTNVVGTKLSIWDRRPVWIRWFDIFQLYILVQVLHTHWRHWLKCYVIFECIWFRSTNHIQRNTYTVHIDGAASQQGRVSFQASSICSRVYGTQEYVKLKSLWNSRWNSKSMQNSDVALSNCSRVYGTQELVYETREFVKLSAKLKSMQNSDVDWKVSECMWVCHNLMCSQK